MTDLDALLLSLLGTAELYAVGGRVRDELRAAGGERTAPPKDFDYVVCGIASDDVVRRLESGGKVDVVGASFAVMKFRSELGNADVALPRRDKSTGVGHRDFAIESHPAIPLADDLARRDFRMNMIARRIRDDAVVDPYGGIADIAERRIDILSPRTFVEDPLRLLRAAQFAGRFDYRVSDATRAGMISAASLVSTVSPERIGDEMAKLLTLAECPSIGLELLRSTGVLGYVWPELVEGVGVDQNEWHAYDVYRHNLATLDATPPGDLTLRLAALLHDVGKPRTKDGPHFYRHEQVGADLVPAMLARLRLPNGTVDTVAHLVRQHMYTADPDLPPKALRRFINRIGSAHLERLFALRSADIVGSGLPKRDDRNERFEARVMTTLAERPAGSVRDLVIGGRDVIELMCEMTLVPAEFAGDSRVGLILRELFDRVTDDPALNERRELLRLAAQIAPTLSADR